MSDLIAQIFEVCIIPLLGVLAGFAIKWINAKSAAIQAKTDSDLADKYIQMLTNTVTTCIQATNQTYVNSLKEQGSFDEEAQQVAFQMTYDAVMSLVTEEAKTYLATVATDLPTLVTELIEAFVKKEK